MNELLIVGTGALASLFAARLSAVGVRVTMLGTWAEGILALQEQGVTLVEDGLHYRYSVRATSDPAECAGIQYALVLVKSWQTARAARQLAACLPSNGLAITLQNGIGNREALAQELGPDRVALGVTTYGATLEEPGVVRPGGQGVIALEDHPDLPPVLDILEDAGFTTETTPSADTLVWSKLVINAAINPLTALLQVPNGELLNRPTARTLMAALAEEAAAVAAAQNIDLTFDDPVAAAENVARRTAANRASMFQDMLRQAPTEIDAICGAIVEAGNVYGVPTPVNQTLWNLVKAAALTPEETPARALELVPAIPIHHQTAPTFLVEYGILVGGN